MLTSPQQLSLQNDNDSKSMVNHLVTTLRQTNSGIFDGMDFLHSFGLNLDVRSMWMPFIVNHPLLLEITSYRSKLVIERLIVELNLLNFELIHRILKERKGEKPLLEWLVEDRRVFRLLQHYRVMTSKFKMENCSTLLNCSWLTAHKNTKMDNAVGVKSDDTLCFDKIEYRINGILVPFSKMTFDGRAEIVSVKNAELFGDKAVELQRFEQTQQYLVDMLNIDAFGFISPQFEVGMKFRRKQSLDRPVLGLGQLTPVVRDCDWFRDVVSRVTEDGICTKSDGDDMSTFQWMRKEDIWTKMKFENEKEISNLEFTARAGSKDDFSDSSRLKSFTFENMKSFRIPCNELIGNSFPADAIHIYARPKGREFEYQHIKTLEYHFKSWFVCRYVVDQKETFRIDQVFNVNPLSESLQQRGQFDLVTTSKILISESGGINVAECTSKRDSKQPKESRLEQRDVHGSDRGIIYLSAPNGVVNRGILCCEGTKEHLIGGTVHIFTDDLFENDGRIVAGEGGHIKIECARFVNQGQINPTPNVLIGKGGTMIRKFEICSKYHEIKNNGLDVCGTSYSCSRYLVYPEVFDPNGISKGRHFWSILAVGSPSCYPNVGLLPEKVWLDKMDSAVGYWPSDSIERLKPRVKFNHNPKWQSGETLTVVLDCDRCKVEYFKNEKKIKQCDVIDSGKSWFFAMTFCAQPKNHYRVVETPLAVLQHYQ